MATYLNFVFINAARNGTTSHTVDPSSATGVVSGTPFTPTAGRFLLVVAEASATSTTPSGWTLPTNGVALNNTGLYVWYRTAAGADTFTTTHNGSNYVTGFAVFEFASGTTWTGAATPGTSVAYNGANPTLSGLTGTKQVFAAKAWNPAAVTGITGTWGAPTVEIVDYEAVTSGTDGYWLHIGGIEDYASASYAPTSTKSAAGGSHEALTFAVNVAVGGSGVTLTPSAVTAVGATRAPSVSTGSNVTLTPGAVTAAGATRAPAPAMTAFPAAATAMAGMATLVPVATFTADAATAQAATRAPSVSTGANVTLTPAAATATGATLAPGVALSLTLVLSACTATGGTLTPTVQTSGNTTLNPAAVSATGATLAPVVSLGRTVTLTAQTATAGTHTPTVSTAGHVSLSPSAVTATAGSTSPTLIRSSTFTLPAVTAVASTRTPGSAGAVIVYIGRAEGSLAYAGRAESAFTYSGRIG